MFILRSIHRVYCLTQISQKQTIFNIVAVIFRTNIQNMKSDPILLKSNLPYYISFKPFVVTLHHITKHPSKLLQSNLISACEACRCCRTVIFEQTVLNIRLLRATFYRRLKAKICVPHLHFTKRRIVNCKCRTFVVGDSHHCSKHHGSESCISPYDVPFICFCWHFWPYKAFLRSCWSYFRSKNSQWDIFNFL